MNAPANVWAVGRNYAEHAKELGNETPTEPLIFLKAGSTVTRGSEIRWAKFAADVHHEIEIALEFGTGGEFTRLGLALDLTERSVQTKLKAKGQPWTLAKSFAGSCPLSELKPIAEFGWNSRGEGAPLAISLWVNGEVRQRGSSDLMIFAPGMLGAWVNERFPVVPGDLLLTGTPAGVGPLKNRDLLQARVERDGRVLLEANWTVRLEEAV